MQKIYFKNENRGQGLTRALDQLWDSWKLLDGGTFSETNESFTLNNINGDTFIAGKKSEPLTAMCNRHYETDKRIFEIYEGQNPTGGYFILYRFKDTNRQNEFVISSIGGVAEGSSIHFEVKAETNTSNSSKSSSSYLQTDNFENFIQKFSSMSMAEKMQIALQTDTINNRGANAYNDGNTALAIENFKQALRIMPTNDDALINLARCYTKNGEYKKSIDPLNKLNYINPKNRSKIIAYSLLMHLLEDFDSDSGAVSPSTLIKFISDNFNISTNNSEIKSILQRINQPYNRDILVYVIGGFGFGMNSDDSPYMTSAGTTKSVIRDEIKDVLDWE